MESKYGAISEFDEAPKLTPGVEESLLKKLDFHIVPWLSLLYFLSYLDRSNIGNVHDPLTEDLDLTEEQFSLAVSIFYIGYIIFEIPANMVLKKANPAYWIGFLAFSWGVCSTSMAFINSFGSLLTLRAFLGIAEAGFFPGVIYFLNRWYKPEEQSLRLALFYCCSDLSGVASGLLASGFLRLNDPLGIQNWRWLFLCEGIPSIICGMLTWYILPSIPAKMKKLTEPERLEATSRLYHIKDDGRVIQADQIWKTLLSLKAWGFCLMIFCLGTPGHASASYGPAIISEMGFDTVEANLLSALISLNGFGFIILNGFLTNRTQRYSLHVIVPIFLCLLGFVSLSLSTYYDVPQASYASLFFCVLQGSALPIAISWLNSTLDTSTEIAIAAAMMISSTNVGGIIGPNIYGFLYVEPEEGEENGSYLYAHMAMCGFLSVGILVCSILHFFVKPKVKVVQSLEDTPPVQVN